MEKINHIHSTTVGIGKKTSILAKGRVWLALSLLLLAALWGPVGQAVHPAITLIAGDGPKTGAGG